MTQIRGGLPQLARRDFLHACAYGVAALVSDPLLLSGSPSHGDTSPQMPATRRAFSLDQNWLFGGKLRDQGALHPRFDDSAFSRVTLPHCVTKLSWQDWKPAHWEDVWIYRRHFALPRRLDRQRLFLQFDSVMTGATPVVNGHVLPQHLGGYLPFEHEITDFVTGDNVLALAVDSRWMNVPPEGSPRGPSSIDYLAPGGILRRARLLSVPQIFLADVYAKPVRVLDAE
jgi:beta-galactosidase